MNLNGNVEANEILWLPICVCFCQYSISKIMHKVLHCKEGWVTNCVEMFRVIIGKPWLSLFGYVSVKTFEHCANLCRV